MPNRPHNSGLVSMILAYALWGLVPIYWKTLSALDPFELLQMRLILTALTCLALLPLRGSWDTFRKACSDPSAIRLHLLAAFLVSGNWFSFIWAVSSGKILESSLGYFLCPLVSILLGRFLEGERLGKTGVLAVFFAAAGVVTMVLLAGKVPLAAIAIAITWSGYGFLKKHDSLGPMVALSLETSLVSPLAAVILAFLFFSAPLTVQSVDAITLFYLLLSGLVTVFPLLLFSHGVKRLRLVTTGMGQYIVPTAHFALAVYFGEIVTIKVLLAFGLIWIGLGLYSIASFKGRSRPESN